MNLASLWGFVITVVGLVLVVGLIFLAITMLEVPEGFKKIAKVAIGGIALLIFLMAVGGALGVGGASISINPMNLIEFAIGLIVVLVVVYIVTRVVAYFEVLVTELNYVIAAVALICILVLAERALFGGGLGFLPGSGTGTGRRALLLLDLPWQMAA